MSAKKWALLLCLWREICAAWIFTQRQRSQRAYPAFIYWYVCGALQVFVVFGLVLRGEGHCLLAGLLCVSFNDCFSVRISCGCNLDYFLLATAILLVWHCDLCGPSVRLYWA